VRRGRGWSRDTGAITRRALICLALIPIALTLTACASARTVHRSRRGSRASRTVYVNSRGGHDERPGTSSSAPVRTLRYALTIAGSDRILLARGSTFTPPVSVIHGGSANRPRLLGAYGRGALPRIAGGDGVACLTIAAAWVTVSAIQVSGCRVNGILLLGRHDTVRDTVASGNGVGIAVRALGDDCVIANDRLRDNNHMVVDRPGDIDDYGAIAIAVNGAGGCAVAHNDIVGSYGPSAEFGEDGSAVELNGASHTMIDRNLAADNLAFSELGGAGTVENTFADNVVSDTIADASFLTVHGDGEFGGAAETRAIHNTVDMSGAGDTALYCDGCSSHVLDAVDNTIVAPRIVGFTGSWGNSHNVLDRDPRSGTRAAGDLHRALDQPIAR
jgi:hypothetical protein